MKLKRSRLSILFFTFAFCLLTLWSHSSPVRAQKDAMKIDEKLSVSVVKKSTTKEVTPSKALPDPVKTRETLEIETKRGVK